jgi:hypothetical protein
VGLAKSSPDIERIIGGNCDGLKDFSTAINVKGLQRKLPGGHKLYQSRVLSFALNCWCFIYKFNGNLLFKFQKTSFSIKDKICDLSISLGPLLQIIDSGKPTS